MQPEARAMVPLILSRYTVASALGKGLELTFQALRDRRSGLPATSRMWG